MGEQRWAGSAAAAGGGGPAEPTALQIAVIQASLTAERQVREAHGKPERGGASAGRRLAARPAWDISRARRAWRARASRGEGLRGEGIVEWGEGWRGVYWRWRGVYWVCEGV